MMNKTVRCSRKKGNVDENGKTVRETRSINIRQFCCNVWTQIIFRLRWVYIGLSSTNLVHSAHLVNLIILQLETCTRNLYTRNLETYKAQTRSFFRLLYKCK